EVQEFRRPEFEVTATASPGPLFVGDTASATVTASYYAGGGLPNAEVFWSIRREPASYAPPGHDDYTFGIWEPWWRRVGSPGGDSESQSGRTNGAGVHTIDLPLKVLTP